MASKSERKMWETFVRRPGELKEGTAIPLVLRELAPGRGKYRMRHVLALVSRKIDELPQMDELRVRTVVGVLLKESWGVKIIKNLPDEIPGKPYGDFYDALKAAAANCQEK